MISDTPNQFKKIIKQVSPDQGAPISVSEKILTNTIKIGNLANKIISYLESIINNQNIINGKLNEIYNVTSAGKNINNNFIVEHMTPRQLYLLYKRGATLEQICLISGYDRDAVLNKINIYMRDNT